MNCSKTMLVIGVVLLCIECFFIGVTVDLFNTNNEILKLQEDIGRKNGQLKLLKSIIGKGI